MIYYDFFYEIAIFSSILHIYSLHFYLKLHLNVTINFGLSTKQPTTDKDFLINDSETNVMG